MAFLPVSGSPLTILPPSACPDGFSQRHPARRWRQSRSRRLAQQPPEHLREWAVRRPGRYTRSCNHPVTRQACDGVHCTADIADIADGIQASSRTWPG